VVTARPLTGVIALASVGAALWILFRVAHSMTMAQLGAAVRATPLTGMGACLLATAASFAALGYYDRFATRVVAPGRVTPRHAVFTGMVSHAVSNTLGFHVLTGGALRYRLYREAGLGAIDVTRVTALVGVCVGLGAMAALAIALLFSAPVFPWAHAFAVTCLAVLPLIVAGFPFLVRWARLRDLALPRVRGRALAVPLLVGLVEAGAAIFAFYVLLPAGLSQGFSTVAAVVLAATLLGVLSHAPGGVGVFEAAVLAAFPVGQHAAVLAALLVYRILYNLMPFCLAAITLSVRGRI
jgi:glycosyltransferase 2 family protein